MVSSTANPMAMEAIKLVATERGMPNNPMMPKLTMMGKILGITAINPTLAERNRATMTPKINSREIDRLLT